MPDHASSSWRTPGTNGLNLLTFDSYPVKYQDPEQNQELLYPVFKTYNIGINITF